MNKVRLWLNYFLILGGTAALITHMFFVFYPFKPFVVKGAWINNPIPAGQITPVVKAGETLHYSVDYCRYTNKGSTVNRQIVSDTHAVPYPAVTSVALPGCHIVSIPLAISATTPPGIYRLRVSADFQVNALRIITTTFETNGFRVE